MPPKKKNKYANAATRGFATISIPKAKAPEPELEPEPIVPVPVSPHTPEPLISQELPVEEDENVSLAERLESLSLRKVDAFLGQSQKINVDNLPVLKMETTLESNVIALLKEAEAKDAATFVPNVHLTLEQMVTKLNVTYLSLLRLGFEKDDIEMALRHTYIGESEDALDWLCMHLEADKLPRGFADKLYHEEGKGQTRFPMHEGLRSANPKLRMLTLDTSCTIAYTEMKISVHASQPNAGHTPTLPDLPVETLRSSHMMQRLEQPIQEPSPTEPRSSVYDTQKEWILQAALAENTEDEAEDPNERYVNYQMTLSELAKALNESKEPVDRKAISRKIDTLNSTINDLDLDFGFDKRIAEMMLKSRIKEEHKATKKSKRKKDKEQAALKMENQDVDDDADGEMLGSMWDLEVGIGDSAAVEHGSTTTIRKRHMANPSWSGASPKTVLAEFCRKKDRHSKIAFKKATESTPSVSLATVTITWGNGSISTAEMKDEGCESFTEAENYVATKILYDLTSLPMYRSLPPTYRDLWLEWIDEMEMEGRQAKKMLDGERLLFIKTLSAQMPKRICGESKHVENSDDLQEQTQLIDKEVVITDVGRAFQSSWKKRLNRPAYQKLFEKRKELPMFQFREQLLDLLKLNQVVIVSGETGCGKSTQVPQYLVESMMEEGLGDQCDIVCTQPRRISAISIANRVSEEFGDWHNSAGKPGTLVGYQIRLESMVAPTNVLKFCTTGILLRRLESDKVLKGVTHLVIDEVHERTLESDFLLIILKKLLPRRRDLKVILMSATVDSARFSQYFAGCPILEVPGRTFPVCAQFLEDVIDATGYTLEEDSEYALRLHKNIQSKGSVDIAGKGASRQTVHLQWETDAGEYAAQATEARVSLGDSVDGGPVVKNRRNQMLNRIDESRINYELIQILLEYICFPKDRHLQPGTSSSIAQTPDIPTEGAILIFLPGMPEIRKLYDIIKVNRRFGDETQFSIWPLHSSVSSEKQSQVFDVPPRGIRKIVLATNIAETGITIPDVTIVIDTGKSKQIKFDEKKRLTTLQERFIARSNARQRRGRAGRVQEGVCFHMFSKTTFEERMPEYQMPEIMRMPLEELCLMIKICELGDIAEVLGGALDAPPLKAIENAIQALQDVRALTKKEELTPLGIHLCNLPVDVHIGKMILFGSIFKCLDPILTIAAMLSYKSPFVTPFGAEAEADAAKQQFKLADSDMLTWYNAYLGWRKMYQDRSNKISDYCRKNFLSHQNLLMIEDMKKQFLGFLVGMGFVRVDADTKRELTRERFNHKISFCPVIPAYNQHQRSVPVLNAAITAGMYPKVMFRSDSLKSYVTGPKQESVWIHPSSVNFTKGGAATTTTGRQIGAEASPWFVFNSLVKSSRMYVWECCRVGQFPLVLFGGELSVKHHAKLVTVDKWIQFKCHAKTAVVFKMMREELGKILQKRIDDPEQAMMEREERWLAMIVAILEGEEDSAVRPEDRAAHHQRQKEQTVFLA
ncbi:hypothetical protein BG004_002057 [Podila humilis]|nr:hypothetical protein BG004_002057 [Podila humilis]